MERKPFAFEMSECQIGKPPRRGLLYIQGQYCHLVKDSMPGVLAVDEDEFEYAGDTVEFDCELDPLAPSPEAAVQALTDYLNAEIAKLQADADAAAKIDKAQAAAVENAANQIIDFLATSAPRHADAAADPQPSAATEA